MVHPAIKPDSPRAARWLIEVCARGIYNKELIGDLEEGFYHRRLGRADRAVFWYWSQVLRSAPLLLARRAGQIPAQRVGLLLLVYLTALLAINIWECLKLFAAQSISQRCCRPSRLNSKVRI